MRNVAATSMVAGLLAFSGLAFATRPGASNEAPASGDSSELVRRPGERIDSLKTLHCYEVLAMRGLTARQEVWARDDGDRCELLQIGDLKLDQPIISLQKGPTMYTYTREATVGDRADIPPKNLA